jgi:type III pantothenate kinase
MMQENRSLVIDAGNTRIKVGVFHNSDIQEVHSFDSKHLSELKSFLQQHDFLPAIIASVKADKDTRWLKQLLPKALLFKTTM